MYWKIGNSPVDIFLRSWMSRFPWYSKVSSMLWIQISLQVQRFGWLQEVWYLVVCLYLFRPRDEEVQLTSTDRWSCAHKRYSLRWTPQRCFREYWATSYTESSKRNVRASVEPGPSFPSFPSNWRADKGNRPWYKVGFIWFICFFLTPTWHCLEVSRFFSKQSFFV